MGLPLKIAFVACLLPGLLLASPVRADDKDLVDRLILDPSLKTFTKLIAKAGLIEMLKGDGPYTIFAPNDAAFAKMSPAALEALMKDKALLRRTLNFHVVSGTVLAKDFKEGPLKTMAGDALTIKLKSGLTVGGVKVVLADVVARNGVIQVVGSVFMVPPTKK